MTGWNKLERIAWVFCVVCIWLIPNAVGVIKVFDIRGADFRRQWTRVGTSETVPELSGCKNTETRQSLFVQSITFAVFVTRYIDSNVDSEKKIADN